MSIVFDSWRCGSLIRRGAGKLFHNCLQMKAGSIDMRKIRIGAIEHQRLFCPCTDDRLDTVSLDERVSKLIKSAVLLFRSPALVNQLKITLVNEIDLGRPGSNHINSLQPAEQSRFHGE